MRKFNITVNGKTYEVEVEEIGGSAVVSASVEAAPAVAAPVAAAAPAALVKAEAPKPAPTQKPSEKKAAPAGGEVISCPMPGTILDVKVKEGQSVKRGDVMFILEAMKMENEIMAPRDGVVAQIGVSKGSAVNTGDMLASLL